MIGKNYANLGVTWKMFKKYQENTEKNIAGLKRPPNKRKGTFRTSVMRPSRQKHDIKMSLSQGTRGDGQGGG